MASRDMGGMGRTAGRGQFGRGGLSPKIRSVRPTVPTKIKDNLAKELTSIKAANRTAQKALPKGAMKDIVVGGAYNIGIMGTAGVAAGGKPNKFKSKSATTKRTKPFWDKPNPKKKSTPLSPAQKAFAKKRAKAAGRPYPNLVDNAAVRKKK